MTLFSVISIIKIHSRIYTKHIKRRERDDEGRIGEKVRDGRADGGRSNGVSKACKTCAHVYGKYGTIKKKYLEEHDWVKTAALGKDLPEYLHAIDRAADDLYETMYEKLKKDEHFRRTGNFLEDVRRENMMKSIIEEEILSELICGEAEL